MIVQRREFANYLRKNSGVKGDATSSEIQGACSAKLEQCEWPSNAFMAKALPDYLVNQVTAEVRLATRRMFTACSVRRSLASQKGCGVNIGCGKNPIQGWINLDVVSYPGVYFWDRRLGYHFQMPPSRKGVLRLVVPDVGASLRAYSGPWELLAEMRPLARMADGWRDNRLGWTYQTRMQFMNAIFRQRAEHKYAYDAETLVLVMQEAGFMNVVVQQFRISIDPNMAPDSNDRRTESLYVEAVKR